MTDRRPMRNLARTMAFAVGVARRERSGKNASGEKHSQTEKNRNGILCKWFINQNVMGKVKRQNKTHNGRLPMFVGNVRGIDFRQYSVRPRLVVKFVYTRRHSYFARIANAILLGTL